MENQHLINDAIKCAETFLKNYRGTDCGNSPSPIFRIFAKKAVNNGYKVFEALVKLTSDDLKNGKTIDDCQYETITIAEKMEKEWSSDFEDSDKTRAINRYFRELKSYLSVDINIEKIKEISIENNFSVIPILGMVKSSGKHQNKYYLSYQFISEDDVALDEDINQNFSEESSEINSNIEKKYSSINYIEYDVDFVKLPKVFNWMFNYKLSTARRIYLFLLVCFEAISFILLMYKLYSSIDLSASQFIKNSIWIIIINLFIFFDAKKILDCTADKKIISITPPLTTPSNFYNTQLECVATKERNPKTGKFIRKIQLVSYTAICPICEKSLGRDDVRIDVSKGGKEFHNRLIGRCSESPTEHVFSFDHITRIGKPLRN